MNNLNLYSLPKEHSITWSQKVLELTESLNNFKYSKLPNVFHFLHIFALDIEVEIELDFAIV